MALQLKKLIPYAFAGWIPGGRKSCVLCGHHVWRFMPYRRGSRVVAPLMRTLDVVGSNVDHFECPRCGAHDRERHLFLYLKCSGVLARMRGRNILHFAPEKHLSNLISAQEPAEYVQADLYPNAPGVQRVDMLAMPFADGSFDVLIANHVLEHVPDASAALAEIFRVLKPGGETILQTPYSRKLQHTWEDAGIDTPQARLYAHGQEDHVRLFGRDIFERITAAGFESNVQLHADLLQAYDPATHGVNPAEPFFLFRKPG
ncbi:class I SAM-dependent methyltransferase [Dokdonella sp.]|uniref:class I SAM-dependent methyltransferase n=1 Tax=Dokdonella sp. TaxID=2291710 RepID=UPI0025C5C8CF|nr:class I SAM-dependent methyltransferase [Dokdonella sp.]